MTLIRLPVIAAALFVAACQPEAEAHGNHRSLTESERRACVANGGRPSQGLGAEICAMPTADANRACTQSDDCSTGLCLVQEDGRGACAPYDTMFGCHALLMGDERATICID